MSDRAQGRYISGHGAILCSSISNSPLGQGMFNILGLCGSISNSPLGRGIKIDLGQGISRVGAARSLANQPRLILVGTAGLSVRGTMLMELILMLSWSIMAVHAAAELLYGVVHRGKVRVSGRAKTGKRVKLIMQGLSDLEYSLALGLGQCIILVFIHKDFVLSDVSVGNGGFDVVNSLLVGDKFSTFGDVGRVRVGTMPSAAAPVPAPSVVATPTSTSASAAAKSSHLAA